MATPVQPSFVQMYLAGNVEASAIDDYVERWHTENNPDFPCLAGFLGFTSTQYTRWATNPSQLDQILRS